MPVVFLVPVVLAALAAIGVPVVLHLRRRERERPMRFPSLMFLQRVTISTARRRRITDWPLLLMRAAILALIVLAFARPVRRPKPDIAVPPGSRRVIVVLDRSMSMGHRAVWPAAVDSARNVIRGLGAGDRVAVVGFDENASVEQELTTDRAAALAAIDRIHPGARGTRYGAGIRAAREVLAKEADQAGGEILVVTDLQRNGAAGMTDVALPAAVTLRAVDASPRSHGNSAVAGVTVERLRAGEADHGRLAVSAQLVSHGLAAPRHAHVTLALDGRGAAAQDVVEPADGATTATFHEVPLPLGAVQMTVALDADSLVADDTFRVVVPAQRTRRLIVAVPGDLAPDELLYFERALETGTDPALQVERRATQTLDATVLHDAIAIVLYDVPLPGSTAGTALAAYVHDGGGLIAVAGTRLAARRAPAAMLPGTVAGMVDRTADGGGVLGGVATEHPIFAPFRGSSGVPVGDARFYRYARLTPGADAQVLARFDDGSPALLEREDGAGRVLESAVPLDATSGDLPLQPTYLPFLRGMVLYAAGGGAEPLSHVAGEDWTLPPGVRNPVVRTPTGRLLRPELRGGTRALTLDEAGFYAVYEGQPAGDPVATLAVNGPPRESDLTRMAPSDLLVGVGQDTVQPSVQRATDLVEAERRESLWRTLLLLALAALVGESWVASRGWRGTAAKIVGVAAGEGTP